MLILLLSIGRVFAQEGPKSRADELLQQNKPSEALPFYLSALKQNPQDPEIFRNLGYVYELLGETDKALGIYRRGAETAQRERDIFFNALGRTMFKLEQYEEAESEYSRALNENSGNYGIYVNRGNARVALGEYEDAVEDYTMYLSLESEPRQEGEIRRMIDLLQGMVEEEKARIAAEEARQREEAAKQKALLDSVLSSLDDVSQDTQSLSAGAEDIETPDIEIELVD